jgi:glycosyltransferase involved in cell wall biosynthesis
VTPRITVQLCTYNRAALLGRVLDAYFAQTLARDAYEIVLVDDGSRDETPAVIARAQERATCAFTVVRQANAGLAAARNAGIARARGTRILFTDDDVLATPVLLAEHLRTDADAGDVIVRGAVINTEDFDHLPPPIYGPRNYSGNYFWTSNVSVRRARLDRVGGTFDTTFAEYGWEDIELGMRLRAIGTRAVFNAKAVAFHHKPAPKPRNVAGMERQARAQARTAVQLARLHPHWRVTLAIGDTPLQRFAGHLARRVDPLAAKLLAARGGDAALDPLALAAARVRANAAYYEELERAKS